MSEHADPPYSISQAVAINFAAGMFVGFYLISVAYANRWLIFTDEGWKLRKKIHWHTLVATNTTLMLVLVIVALAVNSSIAKAAFVEQRNALSDYEGDPWKGIVQMYRLWVVYMKRMTVMWFPFFLWLGGIVCISMGIFLQVEHVKDPNFGPYKWAKVEMQAGPGIIFLPFLASAILMNGYCTGLLVWQIWKSMSSSSSNQLQILMRILMESGVLYLAMNIAHFVAYLGHSGFVVHMNAALHTVVIGIAYDLIIIRVGLNRTDKEANMSTGKLTTVRFASDNVEEKSDQSAISVQTREE